MRLHQGFLTVLCLAVAAGPLVAAEADWPRWRGPRGDGHTLDTSIPVKWNASDITWKTQLPGEGESSPIILGERIFLTSALEKGRRRIVFCLDRNGGELMWQHTAWTGEPEPIHKMNSWASSTCATDGEVVVAFFGRGGLHGYTIDGQHLWSLDLGPFESPWGVAACPILVGDLVIQNCDADAGARIVAVNKRTGDIAWDTKRPDNRGWSTPIIVPVAGTNQVVVNGHTGVRAYDPKDGREIWFCQSMKGRGEPTVTPVAGNLCVVNGLSGDMYAVQPDGRGDVSATHMKWHTPRKAGRDLPSPIAADDYVIVVSMSGVASGYDGRDGREIWKDRLGGNFSATPFAAGKNAYFINEDGRTYVVEIGPEFKIVAENEISPADDEIFRASPTPSDGQIFLRSQSVLYCIGKRTSTTAAQ